MIPKIKKLNNKTILNKRLPFINNIQKINLHTFRSNDIPSSTWKKEKGLNSTIHLAPISHIKIKKINFSSLDQSPILGHLETYLKESNKLLESKEFKSLNSTDQENIKRWVFDYQIVLKEQLKPFVEQYKVLEDVINFGSYFTKMLDPKRKEYNEEINRLEEIISILQEIIEAIKKNPLMQVNQIKGSSKLPESFREKSKKMQFPPSDNERNAAEQSIQFELPNTKQIEEELENVKKKKQEEDSKLNSEKDQGKVAEIKQCIEKVEKEIEEKEKSFQRAKEEKEKMITDQVKRNRMHGFRKELEDYLSLCSTEKKILENLINLANQLISNVKPSSTDTPNNKSYDPPTTKSYDPPKKQFNWKDPSSWNWQMLTAFGTIIGAVVGAGLLISNFQKQEEERRKKDPRTYYNLLADIIEEGNAIPEEKISKYLDVAITSHDATQNIFIKDLSYDSSSIKVLYGSSGDGKTELLKRELREREKNVAYLTVRVSKQNAQPGRFPPTLRDQLNHLFPPNFQIPDNMNPWEVVKGALEKIYQNCGGKWSKDNPIPVIVIDDIHSWIKLLNDGNWALDFDAGQMAAQMVELILYDRAIFIFGVSEREGLPAFGEISGYDGRHKKIRYEPISDKVFEEALKGSSKMKKIFGNNIDAASREITELIGSNFSTFGYLMEKLEIQTDLTEKNEQEVKELIIKSVNQLSENGKFDKVMDEGLVDDLGKIPERKKSSAALTLDLIIRCVSNEKNTKHLPFYTDIFFDFERLGYPITALSATYRSIDYLSELNLVHRIDHYMTAQLHKRIISQTWKQWNQGKDKQNRLEKTRKMFTLMEKDKNGKEIERIIFPTPHEIDDKCSQFYQKMNAN